jgi:hypothetical protein
MYRVSRRLTTRPGYRFLRQSDSENPYDVETSSINGPEMSGISWTFTREPIPVVTILLY